MSAWLLKRKRTDTTLKKKLEIIDDRDRGMSYSSIASKYGIGKTTAQDIFKQRNAIRRLNEENRDLSSRHRVKSHLDDKHLKLDQLIWQWFSMMRSKNLSISGPLIQQKAVFFAKELNITDFKASNGWLAKWKSRHNITALIPTLTMAVAPESCFNADEIALEIVGRHRAEMEIEKSGSDLTGDCILEQGNKATGEQFGDDVEIASQEAAQSVNDKDMMRMFSLMKGYFLEKNHPDLLKDVYSLESSFYSYLMDQKLKSA